jgi:hypothetical protein
MSDQIPNAEEQAPDIDAIFEELKGQPIEQQVPALIAVLKALIGQLADVDSRVCKLDSDLHEGIMDPIHQQYQASVRGKGIEDLKGKYGSKFDEIADPLKAFGIDDVYSFLYDKLDELRKAPDYAPEQEEEAITNFHKGAMDRIGRIRGTPPAVEVAIAEKTPEAAKESETPKEPPKEKKTLREKKMSMMGDM